TPAAFPPAIAWKLLSAGNPRRSVFSHHRNTASLVPERSASNRGTPQQRVGQRRNTPSGIAGCTATHCTCGPLARRSVTAPGVREPRACPWCTTTWHAPARLPLPHLPWSAARQRTHVRWPAPGGRAGDHDTAAVRRIAPLNEPDIGSAASWRAPHEPALDRMPKLPPAARPPASTAVANFRPTAH